MGTSKVREVIARYFPTELAARFFFSPAASRLHAWLTSFVCWATLSVSSLAGVLPPGFTETLIVQGLDPTDMALAPDGRIFITIKSGKVVVVEDGHLRPDALLTIESEVDNYDERGLGHILLDPDFPSTGFYYIYYTVKGQNYNRLSRFTAVGNFSDPSSEVVLFEGDVMIGTIHNGGDMAFGADGKLYVSTGDGVIADAAQSLSSSLGKVLRLNSDGTIPDDNPFSSVAAGKYKAIYALGFRNPFSLDIDRITGKIFVSEVGQETWEEVNHVEAGRNYGWPGIEGRRDGEVLPPIGTYADPLHTYVHGQGVQAGCAAVGAAFYSPGILQFPEEYLGKFFFADYCNGYIKSIDPDDPGNVQVFAENVNRPLVIMVDDEGSLYYIARGGIGGGSETDNTSSQNGTLWKVIYNGSGSPSISVPPQDAVAAIGEMVTFSVLANGTAPLSYQWQASGVDIAGANGSTYSLSNAQLADNGRSFRCRVSNSFGTVTSDPAILTVANHARPQPQFTWTLSSGATLYQGGDNIAMTGAATDPENGALPSTALSWKIDFHHDEHSHPALPATSGSSSLSYAIPKVGETSPNVWYRIYLTATDRGSPPLSKTIYKDLFPEKTTVTLLTSPSGFYLLLDDQPVTTPYTFSTVVNTTRKVEAPPSQLNNNILYVFERWQEIGTQNALTFDVPKSGRTLTAAYQPVQSNTGSGLTGNYYNQDKSFDGSPTLVRLDPVINFDWGLNSPDSGISNDHFTVRWTGAITPQFSEEYTFYFRSDDGARVWVNDILLIDKWIDQGSYEWTGSIPLLRGRKYPLKIEYFENTGGAVAALSWSSPRLPKQIIPTSQLYDELVTATDAEAEPVRVYPTLTRGEFNVESGPAAPSHWVLLDVIGRAVMSGEAALYPFTINIGSLPAGPYIFRVGTRVFRVMKI